MPFTPFHMGPGIAIKALLQGSFSLMVFGWSQILMDLQPLLVLLTGEGHLHGFSHTWVGATLLALVATLTGKYLSEIGLYVLGLNRQWQVRIAWWVAALSAFIGTFSHILLDSVMHADMVPGAPLFAGNPLLGRVSLSVLHQFCLYTGVLGGVLFWLVDWRTRCRQRKVCE